MENQEKAENSLEGAIKGPSLPLFIISGRPERSWDLSKGTRLGWLQAESQGSRPPSPCCVRTIE